MKEWNDAAHAHSKGTLVPKSGGLSIRFSSHLITGSGTNEEPVESHVRKLHTLCNTHRLIYAPIRAIRDGLIKAATER